MVRSKENPPGRRVELVSSDAPNVGFANNREAKAGAMRRKCRNVVPFIASSLCFSQNKVHGACLRCERQRRTRVTLIDDDCDVAAKSVVPLFNDFRLVI